MDDIIAPYVAGTSNPKTHTRPSVEIQWWMKVTRNAPGQFPDGEQWTYRMECGEDRWLISVYVQVFKDGHGNGRIEVPNRLDVTTEEVSKLAASAMAQEMSRTFDGCTYVLPEWVLA